jgi:hypothetical protein
MTGANVIYVCSGRQEDHTKEVSPAQGVDG